MLKVLRLVSIAVFLSLNFSFEAQAKPPTAKIIEGTRVPVSEHPEVAQLLLDGETQCTGTLVGSRHILTAAHCFFGAKSTREVGDTDLVAVLGGKAYQSAAVYIHPSYKSRAQACVEGEVDAAVVVLDTDVTGINPVPLLDTVPPVGTTLFLAGFGLEGDGEQGQVDRLPPDGFINIGTTVIEGYGDFPPKQNPNSIYIYWTFDPGEANTASGDSGGPAMQIIDGQKFLAGITCGGGENAEYGSDSFDTRTDVIKQWVGCITGAAGSKPCFFPAGTITGTVGTNFFYPLPVGGSAPITITADGLPPGLTFDGTNIVGVPSAPGTYQVTLSGSNSFGGASGSITIVISGYSAKLTIQRVLLQFDYVKGSRDFLDISGKISVAKNFKPAGKRVTVQVGRFVKQFKLRSDGLSATGNKNFFDLAGKLSKGRFKQSNLKYFLTLERQSIFDELATLGFPSSINASQGQEVVLPLSVTVDGIESSAAATIVFNSKDARWRIKK